MNFPRPLKRNPNLIENARDYLLTTSHEIRIGRAEPRLTRRMAACAFYLMRSEAPAFEKANTLATVQANLNAVGVDTSALESLANQAVRDAYPPTSLDAQKQIEADALKRAMQNTNPHRSFQAAFDDALAESGRPHEPLIFRTENSGLELTEKAEAAKPATGKFDPFADDD